MKYYKNIKNKIITSISSGEGEKEITVQEYNNILALLKTAPQKEGKKYLLSESLNWEEINASL